MLCLNKSKIPKIGTVGCFQWAQYNHVVLRDTLIHAYTLAHNHGKAEGSHVSMKLPDSGGIEYESSIGALLLLTEGVTPLLLNHSRRVGFPTALGTLSRGRSLSLCREQWCQQINVPGIFLFRCIFLGRCTLKLITLSLWRARGAQEAFPVEARSLLCSSSHGADLAAWVNFFEFDLTTGLEAF